MPPKRKASAAVERLPITTEPADNGRKGKKLKEAILLITKSCLTPWEALKLCESTGFEGIVSSSDISKALDPLISARIRNQRHRLRLLLRVRSHSQNGF
ncbi:hypothetical protein ACHAXN_003620 [Cyclotella atomus]